MAKYGGSVFWALMVYWLLSTLAKRWRPRSSFVAAGLLATTVEFLKLWHTPGLDAFRRTLPGILLLGRHFSFLDIVAYWLAIASGAVIDHFLRQRWQAGPRRTQVA